eukprot:7004707-Prymnesium_polylepis.1
MAGGAATEGAAAGPATRAACPVQVRRPPCTPRRAHACPRRVPRRCGARCGRVGSACAPPFVPGPTALWGRCARGAYDTRATEARARELALDGPSLSTSPSLHSPSLHSPSLAL